MELIMFNRLRVVSVFLLVINFGFAQFNPETTLTVCWDTSFSMKDRNLDKELAFLDSVITTTGIRQVQLLNFSNMVQEENFSIEHGDWSALRKTLSDVIHDGSTDYQGLNQIAKKGHSLVFTDGNKVSENDFLSLGENDILINTSGTANHKTLQLWEYLNKTILIDHTSNAKISKDGLDVELVKGFVYFDGQPLNKALISSSSGLTVITNVEGKFEVEGKSGDTLLVAGGTAGDRKLVVNNPEVELKFFLDSNTISLDEVIVSDTYVEKLEAVNTGFSQIERRKVGFAVYDIPEERISAGENTMTDVLRGEVPGLIMGSPAMSGSKNGGLSTAKVRGKTSINFDAFVLVVIDGTPVQRTILDDVGVADYNFIDPANIKSIEVLKGLAATNLFGSEGKGGVILIKTKTASNNSNGNEKLVDQARLTNNIFDGKLISKKEDLNTPYLKELKKANDLKEAYTAYFEQRKQYLNDYWYFIDVSDYFRTANVHLGDKVLSNVLELPYDYAAQRTLFLKYMELGQWNLASTVAQRMMELYPKNIQPYLDATTALKRLHDFQAAAEILNAIVTGTLNAEIDFAPVKKLVGIELRNLVNQHRNELDISKIDKSYMNNITYNARMRFDWVLPNNKFILKFVNPQNRFFDWEHSNSSDSDGIREEIKNGFGTKQFELVGEMTKGKWRVYVTNLTTNDNENPYWIKCTIDYNFGKPDQRSEEKLIRLDPSDDTEQLFFEIEVN